MIKKIDIIQRDTDTTSFLRRQQSLMWFLWYTKNNTQNNTMHMTCNEQKTFIIIYCCFCLQQIINPHEIQQTNEKQYKQITFHKKIILCL